MPRSALLGGALRGLAQAEADGLEELGAASEGGLGALLEVAEGGGERGEEEVAGAADGLFGGDEG